MTHFSDTRLALSRITDAGQFEHLATAVLRGANPSLYAGLVQSGTNSEGSPVKSPVDGVTFVSGAKPRHMVVIHHTTSAREGLAKKWYYDPATTKPRKGGRPSTPAGDILKVVALAEEERRHSPELRVTLALTANTDPPQDVVREAERWASNSSITLDIWSGSRIAGYLDDNPDGQWLRKSHLGIAQVRLSVDLLRALSQRSLEAHVPSASQDEQVLRESAATIIERLPRPVGILAGPSGFGKSVASHRYLKSYLERGGLGIVLPHGILENSLTPDAAIGATLRQFNPELEPGAGKQALALASIDQPLLLIVEDISRSAQSSLLLERLLSWVRTAKSNEAGQPPMWRLICPIWPELLSMLSDTQHREVQQLVAHLGAYTPDEARRAVLKRAALAGHVVSALDADEVSTALALDPLLIGLYELGSRVPAGDVIGNFISGSVNRLARTGTRTASEYAAGLRALATAMLQRRCMEPRWSDVLDWFFDGAQHLVSLRELVRSREVIFTSLRVGQDELLIFRHDRVRHFLLADAVSHAFTDGALEEAVLADPFFADVVGAAIAGFHVPQGVAERARQLNPLSLFYALQRFREPTNDVHREIMAELDKWFAETPARGRAHQSLRYAALGVLAETQSTRVPDILARFRVSSWAGDLAGLRNGDLRSGIRLCESLEPGTGAVWRDVAMQHAVAHFGPKLVHDLALFLSADKPVDADIVGGLRLAGHIGAPDLANAIRHCWDVDENRKNHLDDYLWAAAECSEAGSESLLSAVCDAWAALPDVAEKEGHSAPRYSLAANHVAWAFWQRLPEPALDYFIRRASTQDLRWPIVYMLRGLDHPKALAFLVDYTAERARGLDGTNGFDHFPNAITDHWRRQQQERGVPMSLPSRSYLQDTWTNPVNDKHVRRKAFRYWGCTVQVGDIELLRAHETSKVLAEDVLRTRLERGDTTAIPALVEKLEQGGSDSSFWWFWVRYVWSDDLTRVLDEHLQGRADRLRGDWSSHPDIDHHLSETLIRRDAETAERLLLRHWSGLRYSSLYVQAALYVATPRLAALVAKVVAEASSPESLFEHLNMHFGIRTTGHPGVRRLEQLEGLVPYLGLLGELCVKSLWRLCNDKGWYAFRRAHLDKYMRKVSESSPIDEAALLKQLDEHIAQHKHYFIDHWVEQTLESGFSVDDILRVVEHWMSSNRTEKATDLAASIVQNSGSRSHVEILRRAAAKTKEASQIVSDTQYAVFRRTLQ